MSFSAAPFLAIDLVLGVLPVEFPYTYLEGLYFSPACSLSRLITTGRNIDNERSYLATQLWLNQGVPESDFLTFPRHWPCLGTLSSLICLAVSFLVIVIVIVTIPHGCDPIHGNNSHSLIQSIHRLLDIQCPTVFSNS